MRVVIAFILIQLSFTSCKTSTKLNDNPLNQAQLDSKERNIASNLKGVFQHYQENRGHELAQNTNSDPSSQTLDSAAQSIAEKSTDQIASDIKAANTQENRSSFGSIQVIQIGLGVGGAILLAVSVPLFAKYAFERRIQYVEYEPSSRYYAFQDLANDGKSPGKKISGYLKIEQAKNILNKPGADLYAFDWDDTLMLTKSEEPEAFVKDMLMRIIDNGHHVAIVSFNSSYDLQKILTETVGKEYADRVTIVRALYKKHPPNKNALVSLAVSEIESSSPDNKVGKIFLIDDNEGNIRAFESPSKDSTKIKKITEDRILGDIKNLQESMESGKEIDRKFASKLKEFQTRGGQTNREELEQIRKESDAKLLEIGALDDKLLAHLDDAFYIDSQTVDLLTRNRKVVKVNAEEKFIEKGSGGVIEKTITPYQDEVHVRTNKKYLIGGIVSLLTGVSAGATAGALTSLELARSKTATQELFDDLKEIGQKLN